MANKVAAKLAARRGKNSETTSGDALQEPTNSINRQNRRKGIVGMIRPVLIIFLIMPVFFLMFYPMLKMSPRDLPVGIVNLDEGAEFDAGSVNAGNLLIDKIQDMSSGSDDEEDSENADTDSDDEEETSVVNWIVYDSAKEAKQDVKDGKIYGVLVIPKDFSEKQTSQLEAFETLSTALGTMSNGTSTMASGIDTMGSKLGALPKAFQTLASANSQLGDGLSTIVSNIGSSDNIQSLSGQANAISNGVSSVKSNEEQIQEQLDIASAELAKDPEEMDMTVVTEAIEKANELSQTNSTTTGNLSKSTAVVSNGLSGLSSGLSQISGAEYTIANNLNTQASQFSKVTEGTSTLSTALGTLSEGLGTMSDTMGDNVSTAIDTINNGGESADDEETVESAKLEFYLNQSKNPMVATTLTTMITGMSAQSGVTIETTTYNEIPDDLSAMYVIMLFAMLTYMACLIPAMLLARGIKVEGTIKQRIVAVIKQLVCAAAMAIAIALFEPFLISHFGGINLPTHELGIALAVAAFSLIVFALGFINIMGMAGMAIPMLVMLLGSSTGNLPYEYLPEFWQKYLYPWEPIRYLADGIRDVLYWSGEGWNSYIQTLLIAAAVGFALTLIKMLLGLRKKNKAGEITEFEETINEGLDGNEELLTEA